MATSHHIFKFLNLAISKQFVIGRFLPRSWTASRFIVHCHSFDDSSCRSYMYLSLVHSFSLGERASGSWALYTYTFLPHYVIYLFYVYILSSCDLHLDTILYGIYIDTLLYGYRRDTFPPLNKFILNDQ